MLSIEVKSEQTVRKSGVSKRGKDYNFLQQVAYAHLPSKPFPVEMTVVIDADSTPYKVGMYSLHPESVYVDRYGSLQLRPKLVAQK